MVYFTEPARPGGDGDSLFFVEDSKPGSSDLEFCLQRRSRQGVTPVPIPRIRNHDLVSRQSARSRRGFTLIELLTVIAVIAVLAAILFPVFLTARGKAREITCVSNLRQVGAAVSMYAQDYDGIYPYGVDPADRFTPQIWSSFPAFQQAIPSIPYVHDMLQPYVRSKEIFHCASDTGFDVEDFTGLEIDPKGMPPNAQPSSFAKFGTSYYYRTEISLVHAGEQTFRSPTEVNVLFDGAGKWHGGFLPWDRRYVTLFADAHVKNLTRDRLQTLWAQPL